MPMKNSNSKALKAGIAVLTVFVVIISAVLIWQYENIASFVMSQLYTDDDLVVMVEESNQEIRDVMKEDGLVVPREPTAEENKAYTSGEITLSEFQSIITGKTTLAELREQKKPAVKDTDVQENGEQKPTEQKPNEQKPTEQKPAEQKPAEQKPTEQKPTQQKPTQQKPTEQKPTQQKPTEQKPTEQKPTEQKPTQQKPDEQKPKDYDTLISEKVAEMYAIKAEYYAEFNAYWAKAKADFLARPEEEHTQENVAAVVKDKMDEGFAMEDRYDAKIEVVLSELTELLKAADKNVDLVDAIRNAYVAEKKAEKARIMQKYFG